MKCSRGQTRMIIDDNEVLANPRIKKKEIMLNNKPLFSVTVTTYNHGDYIKSTIESVLRQTIQDFEIIVIDDGSPDDTLEKVLSIKDGRLRYFRQKPSGLPAYSRNRAIERSNGRYIALLDGDDIWFPEKLERVRDVFLEHPEADIVCHDIKITGDNSKTIRRTNFGPYPKDMYKKLLLEGNSLGITTTVLKNKIFFESNFWFDEDKKLFTTEDYDFWLRLAGSGKFNFHYLPEVLAEHTVSEKSAILSNVEKNTLAMLYLFDRNMETHARGALKGSSLFKKRRSSVMRSAALSHNYNRDYLKSAKWFLRALKEYPFDRNSYLGLAASLLRIKLGRI